jgi:hypothetical protein
MGESNEAMLDVLRANGPITELSSKLMLYGQFVGSWEGKVIVYRSDGSRGEESCEVYFGWILEGRAIQDVWIAPARKERQVIGRSTQKDIYGTTLRIYDPENDIWQIIWSDPNTQSYDRMIGKKIGEDIVQEYKSEEGLLCQWCFTEITANSFHWIGRESKDEGKTWKVRNEFFMIRKLSI